MKKLLTLFGLLAGLTAAYAQNGEISGKILDENGEGMPSAKVEILDSKGDFTGRGVVTDFDGNYSIKPLNPGRYNIRVSFMGYMPYIQQGIVVNADKTTFIDVKLKLVGVDKDAIEVVAYKVPLIDPGKTSSQNVIGAEEISQNASRNVVDLVATTGGIVQSDQGSGFNIGGQRGEGTVYFVDGVKVIGSPTLPATSIEQIQVITGGVPAKYGDLSGGVINITTKGPSGTLNGGAEFLTSQGLDAGGYNLVNANLTGPLWKKDKKSILGFFAAFEYLGQQDGDPSAIGLWKIRPEVLDSLQRFPLLKKQTSSGFDLRADNVSYKDMYKVKTRDNVRSHNFKGNGRIDLRPADNFTLSVGGTLNHNRFHSWVEQYQLFNTENNPYTKDINWRVFGRFTHNIPSRSSDDDKKKGSAFQNAFYMVQFDYEKYYQENGDDSHWFNTFDYGHIGKFETRQAPSFEYNLFDDTINGRQYRGYIQTGNRDTSVFFTPGTLNPFGTRYTQQYYELLGAQQNPDGSYNVTGMDLQSRVDPINLINIQANQGLINGTRSNLVNNIWFNTGRQYNGYGVGANNDQYRVRLEGSFDILKPGAPSRNKHNFEFGIEYEQRINRYFSVSPLAMWQRARQLANRHLAELDFTNPILRINGQNYAHNDPNRPEFFITDTVLFNRLYRARDQTFFDKSLRQSLGMAVNSTDWIDVDALNPSQLNLNMFSPEDLLQDGAALVGYRGYDPYGNKYGKQPSWNDFFTKRRADGELERAIPAFRPVYAAAYLSDRFYFKDLTFNVGVRVDRFDANQKVLIDQYSLYAIKTAAEVNDFVHPSNIGGDYAVYSDNAKNPTRITGYRNGNTWYDRFGNEMLTGDKVALESSTGRVEPWLKFPNGGEIKDSTFNPNNTFKDYVPQINVMPRLQFSFNITDRALFFAHYDILTQRPTGQVITDPTQWLYFDNTVGGVFNNAGLKPVKTIDFELGFKQVISKTAAVTLSAVYREFRDLIQVRKIVNAYPKDYITFDNIDFGTYKAVKLDFDMRRTGNVTIKANYTLSFAEGTGSDAGTQFNIINAGQPNFRSINFLNYDARHVINATATYSYASGKDYNGPVVKNHQILSNSGISLQLSARSGTPYTAQQFATPTALAGQPGRPISEGTINGSRLPWYFRLNLRAWKDFSFRVGKKDAKPADKRLLAFQVYVQIQNLIDTRNVVGVYRFTGTPSDDGFLSDPSSLPIIQASLNPQAFRDQYAAIANRPNNYSLPRRIFLGVLFSF